MACIHNSSLLFMKQVEHRRKRTNESQDANPASPSGFQQKKCWEFFSDNKMVHGICWTPFFLTANISLMVLLFTNTRDFCCVMFTPPKARCWGGPDSQSSPKSRTRASTFPPTGVFHYSKQQQPGSFSGWYLELLAKIKLCHEDPQRWIGDYILYYS